jgi:hypothetical protein
MDEIYFSFLGAVITAILFVMAWVLVGTIYNGYSYVYFLIGFMTAVSIGILMWASANTSHAFNQIYTSVFCDSVTLPR